MRVSSIRRQNLRKRSGMTRPCDQQIQKPALQFDIAIARESAQHIVVAAQHQHVDDIGIDRAPPRQNGNFRLRAGGCDVEQPFRRQSRAMFEQDRRANMIRHQQRINHSHGRVCMPREFRRDLRFRRRVRIGDELERHILVACDGLAVGLGPGHEEFGQGSEQGGAQGFIVPARKSRQFLETGFDTGRTQLTHGNTHTGLERYARA